MAEFRAQSLTYAHSRTRPVPSLTSNGYGLPPTVGNHVLARRVIKIERCRASNPDCYNRDACPHHAESKALPAKISPLGINLLLLSSPLGASISCFCLSSSSLAASNFWLDGHWCAARVAPNRNEAGSRSEWSNVGADARLVVCLWGREL